jgi:fatty acid desaturase
LRHGKNPSLAVSSSSEHQGWSYRESDMGSRKIIAGGELFALSASKTIPMNIIKTVVAIIVFGAILFALFFFDANPIIWVIVVLIFIVFGGKLKKYLP